MRVSLLPLLAVLVASALGASQAAAHTLEGKVREAGTRRAVPGVVVAVSQTELEVETDSEGAFVLDLGDVRPGTRLVVVARTPGYGAQLADVQVPPHGAVSSVDLFLVPDADATGTVVRERRSRENQARGSHRITEREANELPGTYSDPAKAIENFPGMGRVVLSQGALQIRGALPQESAVYVDDYEIPDLYHFTGSTSVINAPFIESVELVPGGFSARYGRATGGLVTLQTRKLPTDDVHGYAKLDVIDGGAYVGVPVSKTMAVGASARRSFIDVIRNVQRAASGTGEEILLVPTYWDYQLKLDWDPSPGEELVVFAFGSGDREEYVQDGTAGRAPYHRTNDSDFHRVSLRAVRNLGAGFTNTFTPVVGFERNTFDELDRLRFRERKTVDVQLRNELAWRSGSTRVLVGLDATVRHDELRYGGFFAPETPGVLPSADLEGAVRDRSFGDDLGRATAALYFEGTFLPLPNVVLVPGIRFDGYWIDESPTLSVEPRLAASAQLLDGPFRNVLKTAVGFFQRPPDVDELLEARRFGVQLAPQRALQLQAGVEQGLFGFAAISTTAFAIFREGLTAKAPNFPTSDRPLARAVDTGGSGSSQGVEVLLRLERDRRYFGWLTYTIARHEREDRAGSLNGAAYPYPTTTDTTHLFGVVGQLVLPAGFRVGARYRFATGMPFTDVIGGLQDADTGLTQPVFGPQNARRFGFFQALDVRVDWTAVLPLCELTLYADIINVLNLRSEEERFYNHDFSRNQPHLGLPTIPAIGGKVSF